MNDSEFDLLKEPEYPDMPAEIDTHMKKLTWKSKKCDQLFYELKELQEKYNQRVAPDSHAELLTTPENLKAYNWVKSLPDNDHSARLIQYAADKGIISRDFLPDLYHRDSPFFLPVAEKWANGDFNIRKKKLENELGQKEMELAGLRGHIKLAQDELKRLKEHTAKEESKISMIEGKTKAIESLRDLYDRLHVFYISKMSRYPESFGDTEKAFHILGILGTCDVCAKKREK